MWHSIEITEANKATRAIAATKTIVLIFEILFMIWNLLLLSLLLYEISPICLASIELIVGSSKLESRFRGFFLSDIIGYSCLRAASMFMLSIKYMICVRCKPTNTCRYQCNNLNDCSNTLEHVPKMKFENRIL